jgi:hypothetical protein
MKKFLTLISILLLSLTAFSQSATDTSTIQIPYYAAKNIAKDLIKLDSSVALLKLTEQKLNLTESKVIVKDSIIRIFYIKESNYMSQIKLEQYKNTLYKDQYNILQKENSKIKTKIKINNIIGGLAFSIGTIVYIIK